MIKLKFDVVVIGAGPSGMMAALTSARLGKSVVLIERNSLAGKKLLLTGNGRCNLANAEFNLKELVKKYNNGEFLFHAFSVFGPKEIMGFFNELGIKTKIEKNKKVFLESNDSREVLYALVKNLKQHKVKFIYNSEVFDLILEGKKISKLILKNKEIEAEKYILCTGGSSYPETGSDGLGFKIAEKLGHTVLKPRPALSPVIIKEQWVKSLKGLALKDVKIVLENKEKKEQKIGEIIFTHFGISGPAVLDISGQMTNMPAKISIDFFPLQNQENLLEKFENAIKNFPAKTIKNVLSGFLSEKLVICILENSNIDVLKTANSITKKERILITENLKKTELTATGILGKYALVTRGGVSLKEIDHKTMKSKIIDNLFFAGEIINVDGQTGGFNLMACWSTGNLAGKS